MEDTIYEFVKNATKGCKTDREKVIAIHDAIIRTCQYKSDARYFLETHYGRKYEDMNERIDVATKVLKNKKGNEESFAVLFQESCRRLFIPCDVISGEYIWPNITIWNRVYINSKTYHSNVTIDLINTTNKSKIYKKYCFKTPYYFMGTHVWDNIDYNLEKFSKSWKNIDRNNIKTTDDLRRAVVYASYQCGEDVRKTYSFKIKSDKVQTDCANYVMSYDFVNLAKQEYKNGILKVTFN
jgi:hypothetical protein